MTTQADRAGLAGDPLAAGWDGLRSRGLLTADAFDGYRDAELAAVRSVAATDLALGRVFDGHRNAVERLVHHRPHDVPADEVAAAARGEVALGVWGAEPGPGDGPPAVLHESSDGLVLRGVKTFCSGAGLLDRAIVLVRRTPEAPPILPVLVDLRSAETVRIDREWFVGTALRESRSDRVVFDDAPVLAVLGSEGTLSTEPWISGDALRSSAVWAGGVDTVVRRLIEHGRARSGDAADLERLGRADAIRATVDVWLAAGLAAVEGEHAGGVAAAPVIGAMRLELTERIRELLRIGAELTGSRGLVADAEYSAARAGLDVLLLQHRLGSVAVRRAKALLDEPPR